MRIAPLLLLLASSCVPPDHAVNGQYLTNFDSVIVIDPNGSRTGGSVVEVTVRDAYGDTLDRAYVHSETASAPFSVNVPDGSVDVHVVLAQQTADGKGGQIEYQIDGPIESDVELGVVDLR